MSDFNDLPRKTPEPKLKVVRGENRTEPASEVIEPAELPPTDDVTEASEESFPASDPPAYTGTRSAHHAVPTERERRHDRDQ